MSAGSIRQWRELLAMMAIVAAAAVCAPDATAQKNQGPPNALQGFSQNRDEPVKIRATALEVREKDKMATFTGDVYVLQGDTEMRCKVLVVFYDEQTGTRIANATEGGAGATGKFTGSRPKAMSSLFRTIKMRPGRPPLSTCARTP